MQKSESQKSSAREVDLSEKVIDARWMSETSVVAITRRGVIAIEFKFGQFAESREHS
jgi:hypothetical protein